MKDIKEDREYMLRALGEHCLESHIIYLTPDCIGIDELGIPEGDWSDSEILLYSLPVQIRLEFEHLRGGEGSQRMVIGLAEELHAARCSQLPETVNHLRIVAVELLEH